MKSEIFAVDFDGTLVENNYPKIGKPKLNVINFCKNRQKLGNIIILWTCRTGKYLEEALEFLCNRYDFIPNYINENAPYDKEMYPIEGRKINADYYIDDKAIPVYNIDILEEKLNKMLNNNNNNNNENNFLNKVDKTIATNKSMTSKQLEEYLNNINSSAFQPYNPLEDWKPYIGKCPYCGSANIEANYGVVLTSYPPQYNCRCKDCKGTFFSGQSTYENESDSAKHNLPNNPSWVPYQPDITPINPGHDYGYGNRQGWICPRCGKVNSPDRQFCDCNNSTYAPNIVWCNANNSSGNAPTTPCVTTTINK